MVCYRSGGKWSSLVFDRNFHSILVADRDAVPKFLAMAGLFYFSTVAR
jgi:hypothetical protein